MGLKVVHDGFIKKTKFVLLLNGEAHAKTHL